MTKHCVLGSIVLVVVAFAVGFGVSKVLEDRMPQEESREETALIPVGWKEYVDPAGLYSFQYPAGIHVRLSPDGDELALFSAPAEDTPVPDMGINVAAGYVKFRVWENFEIPYFKQLVSSFRFLE